MRLLAAGALAAAFVSISALLMLQERPHGATPYQDRVAFWREEFSDDARGAYRRLIEESRHLSYDESHAAAHLGGELLYEIEGLAGIAACTAEYQFGCYHGFAGSALAREGLESVSALKSLCDTSPDALGCLHGIGHGVLAFLGNEKLVEALEVCASLEQTSPVGGCFGGVFMEYNFNTMQSDVGIAVRPFGEDAANEPCASLPDDLKIPCYFDQPAWWHAAASDGTADEAVRFGSIGKRCAMLESPYRRACFEGIGNVIGPTSGYNVPMMHAWCDTMPSDGRGPCFEFAEGHLKAERL
jgi:hypothetical protein